MYDNPAPWEQHLIDQQTIDQCKMRNAEAFVKANYVLELFDCPQDELKQKI